MLGKVVRGALSDLDQMMRMRSQAAASQKKNQKKTDDKEKKSMAAKSAMDMMGALGNLAKRSDVPQDRSVLLEERPQPVTLSEFMELLPDDFPLTAENLAEQIQKIPDEDIKFYLLRELNERYNLKEE